MSALGPPPAHEFDAIRGMVARWGPRAAGVGDDAAILSVPLGESLIASVDSAVEGQHFRREWLSPREIGYRSVASALSDLAAMAAQPLGILLAMCVPGQWRDALDEIADGVAEAVDCVNAKILGGNLSSGTELSITTTVLGAARSPLRRDGAKPGDRVYVTGVLGGSGEALRLLVAGQPVPDELRRRFARPVPRIAEARWLAEHGATAAIDISDGLAADLGHLGAASRAVVEIDVGRVPTVPAVGRDAMLSSGEEYELVVTATDVIDEPAFRDRFGTSLREIGRVLRGAPNQGDGEGGGDVVLLDGGTRVAAPRGHDHFSR